MGGSSVAAQTPVAGFIRKVRRCSQHPVARRTIPPVRQFLMRIDDPGAATDAVRVIAAANLDIAYTEFSSQILSMLRGESQIWKVRKRNANSEAL